MKIKSVIRGWLLLGTTAAAVFQSTNFAAIAGGGSPLRIHASAEIDRRIGNPRLDSVGIFSTQDHRSGTYVRAARCWANGIKGMSALVPFARGTGQPNGFTAVAPDIVVAATHTGPGPGATLRFVSEDGRNTVFDCAVALGPNSIQSIPETDITVCRLDAKLPAGFRHLRVAPPDLLDLAPDHAKRVAIFETDKQSLATVADWIYSNISRPGPVVTAKPVDSQRADFWRGKVSGDSGHAMCLVVKGELLLLGVLSYGDSAPPFSGGAAGSFWQNIDAINRAITATGSSFRLTVCDLKEFSPR